MHFFDNGLGCLKKSRIFAGSALTTQKSLVMKSSSVFLLDI